ncbi:MAG TPA: hypothetical protein VLA37_06045 [Sphingomonadaceae bacterium]|nr:hypothetical protein [Sphingomonadaceae bacterium]
MTGLARSTVEVGSSLVAGSPLGIAANRNPAVVFELRHRGNPVNPLRYM